MLSNGKGQFMRMNVRYSDTCSYSVTLSVTMMIKMMAPMAPATPKRQRRIHSSLPTLMPHNDVKSLFREPCFTASVAAVFIHSLNVITSKRTSQKRSAAFASYLSGGGRYLGMRKIRNSGLFVSCREIAVHLRKMARFSQKSQLCARPLSLNTLPNKPKQSDFVHNLLYQPKCEELIVGFWEAVATLPSSVTSEPPCYQ